MLSETIETTRQPAPEKPKKKIALRGIGSFNKVARISGALNYRLTAIATSSNDARPPS